MSAIASVGNSIAPSEIRKFLRCRARFQRLGDAKTFHGWLRDLQPPQIVLMTRMPVPVELGQSFHVEVVGSNGCLSFQANLSAALKGQALAFVLASPMLLLPSVESARKVVHGLVVEGEYSGSRFEGSVEDISLFGVGFSCPVSMQPGERVDLALYGTGGTIACQAEVRYCKPNGGAMGGFRIGALITDMDRLSRVAWVQQFEGLG